MLALKIFRGTLSQFGVCASKPRSISSAGKNLRGQQTLRDEIQYSEKSPLWWVNMSAYNVLVSRPKFTKFVRQIGDENVVDQVIFRFSIYGSSPEIFEIKVDSCQKLH